MFVQQGWTQENDVSKIEGRILDQTTKNSIPYAKIYNQTTQKGTISNADGYFRISYTDLKDQLFVTYMGYKKTRIPLISEKDFYTIILEEEDRLLSAITIGPEDNDYLYDLLISCRKNKSKTLLTAKAYYELKSYQDTTQLELVEGFYNVDLAGYDISYLNLKAGRLAIQKHNNRFFTSLESSRAIAQLKTMEKNYYFPVSPLELKKKDLSNSFYLRLISKYVNVHNDSIYQISYQPKVENGLFYAGEIWVNKTTKMVQKINLRCDSCQTYPFLPLFPRDLIENVKFNITKTFTELDGKMVFNHIDFLYEIDYKSHVGQAVEVRYKIKTNAVLYAYDFERKFDILTPEMLPNNASDYRKYNALPYNSFFWDTNDEFRMNDQANQNENFFRSVASTTNMTLFTAMPEQKNGFFEHPFIQWSTNRILFRQFLADTLPTIQTGVIYNNYNLKVDFYIDLNTYLGRTNLLSAVLFNPFESFYHLPIDKQTQCFINIYFDLCEIARRKMEIKIKEEPLSLPRIKNIYTTSQDLIAQEMNRFFKAVDRGTNRMETEKYNAFVYSELAIDNIALFRINDD